MDKSNSTRQQIIDVENNLFPAQRVSNVLFERDIIDLALVYIFNDNSHSTAAMDGK